MPTDEKVNRGGGLSDFINMYEYVIETFWIWFAEGKWRLKETVEGGGCGCGRMVLLSCFSESFHKHDFREGGGTKEGDETKWRVCVSVRFDLVIHNIEAYNNRFELGLDHMF